VIVNALTNQRTIAIAFGLLLASAFVVGLVALIGNDRDSGLGDAEILVDLRSAKSNVASTDRRVKLALLGTPDAEETIGTLKPLLDRSTSLDWHLVDSTSVRDGCLTDYDVLLVPGGNGRKKGELLGQMGQSKIRGFVQSGGGYVGICGGAFLAASGSDSSLGLIDATPLTGSIACGQKGEQSMADRGVGTVKIEFSGVADEIFSENRSSESVNYNAGPIFCRGVGGRMPGFVVLARFRSEIYECEAQRGTMLNRPAIIAAKFGKGSVLLFSPHPELSPQLEHLVIDAIHGCRSLESPISSPSVSLLSDRTMLIGFGD
jgi:glutamine amidotransferase-like uncharacterized protein